MDRFQQAITNFVRKFLVLRGAMPELWISFLAKLLVIAAYALSNSTLVLWLTSDFGYSDTQALATVAFWSLLMSAVTVVVGPLTDALGLRRTLFVGVAICAVSRAVMAFSSAQWLALVFGMFPLAIGEALSTPVLIAAIRRYSSTRQRSMAFSVFYMMMNVGFFIAAFLFDGVRQGLGEHGHLALPLLGSNLTAYRTLFLVSLGLELVLFPVVYFLREGVEATDEGVKRDEGRGTVEALKGSSVEALKREPVGTARASTLQSFNPSTLQPFNASRANRYSPLVQLFSQPGVYRLLVFLLLIAFIKLVLMQIYYVYPKFGIRELGDGAPVGRLWAINSILIVFLAPMVGALTQKYPAYRMVMLGSALTAASVFILAMPTGWFEPLANGPFGQWLGHWYLRLEGTVHPYYVMIALFVMLFSVGEAFYSPRVYEYAAAIAPKGLEASYSALSYVPFLLAKLLVGTFAGPLLATYCPERGVRHSGTMWLIVALTATVAPVGLLALRGFIRVREAGRVEG